MDNFTSNKAPMRHLKWMQTLFDHRLDESEKFHIQLDRLFCATHEFGCSVTPGVKMPVLTLLGLPSHCRGGNARSSADSWRSGRVLFSTLLRR